MARRHIACSDEYRLDPMLGGPDIPLNATVLVEDNGLANEIRVPQAYRKQIRRHVGDDTVAGAPDPVAGKREICRQCHAVVVGPRGEAREPPVDPVLVGLVFKSIERYTHQLYGDISPRRNRKMAAVVAELN